MLDFLMISTRSPKKGVVEIYPKFIIKKSSDLMIRGGDFYAIWVESLNKWSTDEHDALKLIDDELDLYLKENAHILNEYKVKVLHMWDASTGMIDSWHKYCQKQMRDSFVTLDENLCFSNTQLQKKDYASKKLAYPLEKGDISAYDKLMSTLYSNEERHKIEWAIGSIITGDSKKLQKFIVLYGDVGTGKSTVINIITKLFDGYYSVFDAKSLGSASNSFALEAFKGNPLVAIQHDGDLSRIEDNTRLNSLVSHELMTVNEKFKSAYTNSFKSFLFMGTNKPVKITDAKSGLIRRLIDVSPTGNKLSPSEYKQVMNQINFELGAIAYHCKEIYLDNINYYDGYIPVSMLGASNDFYNFISDNYFILKKENEVTLKVAWEMYKTYCDYAKVAYPLNLKSFKEELKNYFDTYNERASDDNGARVRNLYTGFKFDKFEYTPSVKDNQNTSWINFKMQKSLFDKECKDYPAQYATNKETPFKKWDLVKTNLSNIDTSKLHYVKIPKNHIVIDFDIKDKDGNKSLELNLKEANKFPKTYAELSKSGNGIHLHYIYDGDVDELSNVYGDGIEIKVFSGKSSLRRKLSQCNDITIATINSGLPLKKERMMINFETVSNEKTIRKLIKRNLNKEIHPGTKPSIDFIYKILEDAYESGLVYDVSDLKNTILAFAVNSTNQSEYCVKLVTKMKFKSEDTSLLIKDQDTPIVFFDVEIFPNLFVVCWKMKGDDKPVVKLINPSVKEIEELLIYRLIGFNCRRYDNHILYGALMGYNCKTLFNLSQKIISGDRNAFFGEAYNISYTDVYDFSSDKKSLKKFEIELGIHHKELGMRWDEPVPEERWLEVADYCCNDVIATEVVFNARKADFIAREILADLAGMTVNDTTNSLTTRIIFGNERKPQDSFNYRNMGDTSVISETVGEFEAFDKLGRPIFPGYIFENGKSTYRGEEVGEGGYVYAEPGMYTDVALLDIASMHPTSIIAENLFGGAYTSRFKEIVDARLAIKHKDFSKAKNMLGGILSKYLADEDTASALSGALKIAINSVYGLTSARFENAFRDLRNIDNIVAKRGALFMINLKNEVQKRGFTVAHIKTDSIKIPNANNEIIEFVIEYGKKYGYTFEHEATYDRMCLVNDAVYIAKYKTGKKAGKWVAVGAEFAVPYIFKKLFSKEEITFDDLCETKSVTSSMYLDMNENLPDVSDLEKCMELRHKNSKDFTKRENGILDKYSNLSDEELSEEISKGHNRIFIGKVGRFCPMKEGGGLLLREKDGKYYAVGGTKGYRWLESEMVKELGLEDKIDMTYFDKLVKDAELSLIIYGDSKSFMNDDNFKIIYEGSNELLFL